jgi:hypothetical protein
VLTSAKFGDGRTALVVVVAGYRQVALSRRGPWPRHGAERLGAQLCLPPADGGRARTPPLPTCFGWSRSQQMPGFWLRLPLKRPCRAQNDAGPS